MSGALRDAADQAPELDLLAGVGARRRRRTRRRAQLLAAVAVAGVVSTSTGRRPGRLLQRGRRRDGRPAEHEGDGRGSAAPQEGDSDSQSESTVTATMTAKPQAQIKGMPVAKLWPPAVFQMPAKNADGWPYRPITGISATEVLLAAKPSGDKVGKIEVYGTKTGKSRVVTEIPRTRGVKEYSSNCLDRWHERRLVLQRVEGRGQGRRALVGPAVRWQGQAGRHVDRRRRGRRNHRRGR